MSHQSAGEGRGFLIVFEGIDGVGKTTHAHRLAASLRELGWQVEVRKEPTDGPHGKRLRQSGETGRMSAAEELELFLKDRREHVDTKIEPGLAAGKVIILDRYYFSTMAYQGARGFDPEDIRRQNEEFAPRPDCLLIMTAPLDEALSRINERGEVANEFEKSSALQACDKIFSKIQGDWVARVDTQPGVDEVAAKVLAQVRLKLEI